MAAGASSLSLIPLHCQLGFVYHAPPFNPGDNVFQVAIK
jgi:hypothetical protein